MLMTAWLSHADTITLGRRYVDHFVPPGATGRQLDERGCADRSRALLGHPDNATEIVPLHHPRRRQTSQTSTHLHVVSGGRITIPPSAYCPLAPFASGTPSRYMSREHIRELKDPHAMACVAGLVYLMSRD
ncbi:hypothetical protein K456DRAFT_500452 [Colletotrichum gloeosporioides 23]|nr:hypothetical protein K456DRAFT_500452 [Colletotrichum gloeosporioides 23]